MDDDDQEVYAAPSETAVKSSFAQIRQAFEQKNSVPIKVAKDGRHQSKDSGSPSPISPKPSFKPPPMNKPKLFDENTKPSLPQKASKPKAANDKSPPRIAPKKQPPPSLPTKDPKTTPAQRKSERESMFPPNDVIATPGKDGLVAKKQPLKPINGMNLPLKPDQSIIQSPSGSYKQLILPPVGSGPPTKPTKLPAAMIVLEPVSQGNSASAAEEDEGEIYDDVGTPINDLPPPPSDMLRPVSMIPEMTEEDELSDEEHKPRASPLPPPKLPTRVEIPAHEQEVYDDVAGGDEAEQEEIYEDI